MLPKNVVMNQFNYFELLSDYLAGSFEKCQTDVNAGWRSLLPNSQ